MTEKPMMRTDKYKKAELPTKADALLMADEYQAWANTAVENDKPGSARQFELMSLLLRFYGETDVKEG